MKKLITIILILIGLNLNSQESRIDWKDLDEQISLKYYIKNYAYTYLNFQPTKKDTSSNDTIRIDHHSPKANFIFRCKNSILDIPLIIINGYPTDNQEIWNLVRLEFIKEITIHKPTEQTLAIYGQRGGNGVIFVKMNKRMWRKITRKYSLNRLN